MRAVSFVYDPASAAKGAEERRRTSLEPEGVCYAASRRSSASTAR